MLKLSGPLEKGVVNQTNQKKYFCRCEECANTGKC